MIVCPKCSGKLVKNGFLKKERTQRYVCTKCRKSCSDASKRTFGTLRSSPEKILLAVNLLTEGMGIRGAARIIGVHRDTVLRILKHAGTRCEKLLKEKLTGVEVKHMECDEIWTYVHKKSKDNINPEFDSSWDGDYYTFLAMDSETKLLLCPTIGKRTELNTELFANQISKSTAGRVQITSDGFRPYKRAIKEAFKGRADFAQFYKERNMYSKPTVFSPKLKDSGHIHVVRCGTPNPKRITTAHVERANLSMRLFNRRFNRKTVCFSKSEEYLHYSVHLFIAAYNFCKSHSTLGKNTTPAMISKLTNAKWNIESLLASTN